MRNRVIFAAVLVATPLAALSATPTVRLFVPPPGRYGIEDLWKATVVSDTVCNAWFEGRVFEASHGQVFWAKTKPFTLTRGAKVYGYRDVAIDKTDAARGYEAFVTRQGTLPQGSYRFKLILQPFGVGDSCRYEVAPLDPPRLITPGDGSTVDGTHPHLAWTRPAGATPAATYTVKLFQVLPGQTPQEAASANLPWFEQKNIRTTGLTYPMSARALPGGGVFAWQVSVAVGAGTSATSEVRSFERRRYMKKPSGGKYVEPVGVTRRVERERTHFKVHLDVKVISDVQDLQIRVWHNGFQCIPETDAHGADMVAEHAGLKTRWTVSLGDVSGGTTITQTCHAVPILVPEMFWYQWWTICDSAVVTYRRGTVNYIRRPDLHHWPMEEIGAAFQAADFLIVTCPARLFAAYDGDDVSYLLRFCGQLARKKDGVLGYTLSSTTAPQLKTMLAGNGVWGSELAPAFRAGGQGYVLLVGEQNIVPSWEVTGLNVKWADNSVTTTVRLSDFPYADCTGDWLVDLVVGRAIGRCANGLSRVVASAVASSTVAKPDAACLVSGYDSRWMMLMSMIVSTHDGAKRLKDEGVNAAPAHIGVLPAAQKLPALQAAVQGRDLISYFGHGGPSAWADVMGSWNVASLNYAVGTWVVAFSCLTGLYSNDQAICRAFTIKPGTLGYIGSTEVSAHSTNDYLMSGVFWAYYKGTGWRIGSALYHVKFNFCAVGSKYDKLAAYEYNLYGCPK